MPKILVIEDEPMVRESVLDLLRLEDFEVCGAENGLVGLSMARQERPDLIICDVMMPELDGFQVLTALQEDHTTATIPFIFLTAKSDPTDLRQGMELGADDFLTKPFSYDELLRSIETRLFKRTLIDNQSELKLRELRKNLARSLPHELITPLSIILMSTEILLDQNVPLDQVYARNTLEGMYNAGQRLSGLVQKFIRYAELEIAATDPAQVEALRNNSTTEAKLVISSLAKQKARKLGREKDLVLQLEAGTARISPENLEELVEELLDNAFRYSKAGTAVEVRSVADPKFFIICIEDYGCGLTGENIANRGAFMQFDRKKHEQQGIGLGLTLAKRLAGLHGGDLVIKSIPDQKTSIRLSLPL
jgi:CheY-like chemotaxis protein/anti-sigma regulatory factor (Ser/Thr protein kinase)